MKILIDVIVTTFYIGRLPLAPGTWASIAATILWLFILFLPLFFIITGAYIWNYRKNINNRH